jgi:hypothetical protein
MRPLVRTHRYGRYPSRAVFSRIPGCISKRGSESIPFKRVITLPFVLDRRRCRGEYIRLRLDPDIIFDAP